MTTSINGNTPWGNIGNNVSDKHASDVMKAMKEAKMDWKVELEPVFLKDGSIVPKTQVTRRSDNNQVLGVVGDRYKILQNEDAFSWFQPFVDSHNAKITTIGSFKQGSVLFLQAEVLGQQTEVVKEDIVKSYITLAHSHDGSLSVMAGFCPVRMFCLNQLPMLKKSTTKKLLKMRHTKNLSFALDGVREIMDVANKEFVATTEQYRSLAKKGVNRKTLEEYVNLVFRKEDDAIDKEVRKATIDKIEAIFENGKGMSKSTRNYWGAFNSITEYLTWEAGRSTDSRLHSLWFGPAQSTAQRALDLALDLAN